MADAAAGKRLLAMEAHAEGAAASAAALFAEAAAEYAGLGRKHEAAKCLANAVKCYASAEDGGAHEALRLAERLVETDGEWHKAYFRRGEVHFMLGGFKRAASDFGKALELMPDGDPTDEAHVTQCKLDAERRAKEQAENEDEARAIEEELKKQDEEKRKKKETTAEDITLQAEDRDRDPEVKRLHTAAGDAIARQDLHEALALLERVCTLEPTFYQALCQTAMLHYHLGDHNAALAYYGRTMRADANFLRAYVGMGTVLEALGRRDEAEPLYRQSIRINFDQADAWVHLALNLASRGKVRAAYDELQRALKGGPEGKFHQPRNDPSLLYLVGYLSLLLGGRAEPTSLFLRVCHDASSPLFLFSLARVSALADDDEHLEDSTEALAEMVRKHPVSARRDLVSANAIVEPPHYAILSNKVLLRTLLACAGDVGARARHALPEAHMLPGDTAKLAERLAGPPALWLVKGVRGDGGPVGAPPRMLAKEDIARVLLDGNAEARRPTLNGTDSALLAAAYPGAALPAPPPTAVVEQYITNPLLLDDTYKFVVNLYAVVLPTAGAPTTPRVYVSDAGILQVCGAPFSVEDLDDRKRHTTVAIVNEHVEDRVRPISVLADRIGEPAVARLLSEMLEIARSVFESFLPLLQHPYGDFHPAMHARLGLPKFLALEFLVAADLAPVLLEVDRAPKVSPDPSAHPSSAASASALDRAWELARLDLAGSLDALGGGDVSSFKRVV